MSRDQAITYLRSSGMSEEQIKKVVDALIADADEAYAHGYTDAEANYYKLLERKRGEWKRNLLGCDCSVCGRTTIAMYNYCPNCGADMRGEE